MIDPTEIFRDIVEMIQATVRQPVAVTAETRIASDLGLDSVAVMDFVMELEDRFDVSISLDRIAEIEAVGDLVRTISELKEHAFA